MMRVGYVLTGGVRSRYAAMLRLSVALLRRSNPDAAITILADPATAAAIEREACDLRSAVDTVQAIHTPFDEAKAQSRAIKTQMASYMRTPYLYLDVDTAPVGSLGELFERPRPLAMALDVHPLRWRVTPGTYEQIGWRYEPGPYFNAGVIFAGDGTLAQRLCNLWHADWQQSYERGIVLDQPAMNHAMHAHDIRPSVLPYRFNAMIRERMFDAAGARVIHYYADKVKLRFPSLFDRAVSEIADGVATAEAWAHHILAHPYPWPLHPPLVQRMFRPSVNGWKAHANGQPSRATDAQASDATDAAPDDAVNATDHDAEATRGWSELWRQFHQEREKRAGYFETEAWAAAEAGRRFYPLLLMARSLTFGSAVLKRSAGLAKLATRSVGLVR